MARYADIEKIEKLLVHGIDENGDAIVSLRDVRKAIAQAENADVLIRNGIRCKVDHWNVIATAFTEDEKCRLFGIEEAEKALEERREE